MVVPVESFPQKKRVLWDEKLLQSLVRLSREISALEPLQFLLKRYTTSMIRKSQLLCLLFEELLRNPVSLYPPSAILCFEEIYIVLDGIKALLGDCSSCSVMWLLHGIESVWISFNQLTIELSTLLDILSGKELNLNEDGQELLLLIKNQCLAARKSCFDSRDKFLRSQVLTLLDDIKRQIIPDSWVLSKILENLCLRDSTSCQDEIESLEEEFRKQSEENRKAEIVALIGLVRYAKCVVYGESTPRGSSRRRRTTEKMADVNIPSDFRCPITLDLMRDPVVVSTGQTYESSSIAMWLEAGHNTCPKTGQTLAHLDLIPNRALKNLIALWCREQGIPFRSTEIDVKINGVALEATKMTVSFLLNKLSAPQSVDSTTRIVHELRVLAKTDSDCRACIAEAGALPLLVRFLVPENPSLEANAITTILNLSILEANKTRIMETDGVLNGVISVLRSGATWEAKGNAAATLFSLTGVHAYRKILGRKTRVAKGLVDLAREGPTGCKKDAIVAILNLAGDRDGVGKLIESGVGHMVGELIELMPEEAATILELVVKRGGLIAIAASYHLIPRLAIILRDGSDRAKESVAATLVNMCRKGGSEIVIELATVTGIERMVWEIMGTGTGRGKRKAATLLRILRRWAAGIDNDATSNYSSSTLYMSSTTITLPG